MLKLAPTKTLESELTLKVAKRLVLETKRSWLVSGVNSRRLGSCLGSSGERR